MSMRKLKAGLKEIIPEEYELILKEIPVSKISFEKFRGMSVIEWCVKHCKYSRLCGKCPNEFNNYNKYGKEKVKSFKRGVLVMLKVPSMEFAGGEVLKKNLQIKSILILLKILRKLELRLKKFEYKRFCLLGAGNCKAIFCPNVKCAVLNGKKCIHPKLAIPSMEAYGINVFKTVENIGEKMYWIDNKTNPKDVPYGLRVGLILFK